MTIDVAVRLLTVEDAERLAELVDTNREFMAPWDPEHTQDYFTTAGQQRFVVQALARYRAGTVLPYAILADGVVVGRITVNDIVRGPFLSGHLGYWVGEKYNGQGVASAAVAAMITVAFESTGLHRLQAGTLLHNIRSQRVLARNGFTRIGVAPRYLHIAGSWQDHILFQLLNDELA